MNGLRVGRIHLGIFVLVIQAEFLADGSYTLGDKVTPGSDGILAAGGTIAAGTLVLKVVKEYTLPDGQPAVKLQVVSI